MEHDKLETVNHCIRGAAQQAAASGGLRTSLIERFLRTGEETWDGAGSGRFTLAQLNDDEVYTGATKTALRTLFRLLADLLPAEAQEVPQVGLETIRASIGPMVKGLVERDWQEVALRELTARTFVLNFQGAQAAVDAELSTCFMGTAWQILSGLCLGTTGSNQRKSMWNAMACPRETLRTCGCPPMRPRIHTVTSSSTSRPTCCTT